MKKASLLLWLGLAAACAPALADESTAEKAEKGVKKGGEAAGKGIKKGGEAAGKGIEKGAEAAGKGIKKGGQAAARGIDTAGKWVQKKIGKGSDKKEGSE